MSLFAGRTVEVMFVICSWYYLSKPFNSLDLIVFKKEFFEKNNFEKKSAEDNKKAWKITQHAKS